jgi:hypothetical protein
MDKRGEEHWGACEKDSKIECRSNIMDIVVMVQTVGWNQQAWWSMFPGFNTGQDVKRYCIQTYILPNSFAGQMEYPIIIKAVDGGGGRGIKLVKDESALENAV